MRMPIRLIVIPRNWVLDGFSDRKYIPMMVTVVVVRFRIRDVVMAGRRERARN